MPWVLLGFALAQLMLAAQESPFCALSATAGLSQELSGIPLPLRAVAGSACSSPFLSWQHFSFLHLCIPSRAPWGAPGELTQPLQASLSACVQQDVSWPEMVIS